MHQNHAQIYNVMKTPSHSSRHICIGALRAISTGMQWSQSHTLTLGEGERGREGMGCTENNLLHLVKKVHLPNAAAPGLFEVRGWVSRPQPHQLRALRVVYMLQLQWLWGRPLSNPSPQSVPECVVAVFVILCAVALLPAMSSSMHELQDGAGQNRLRRHVSMRIWLCRHFWNLEIQLLQRLYNMSTSFQLHARNERDSTLLHARI